MGMAVMLITHAMGVVAEVAQRVVVMYAGKVVEEAPVRELFARPRHPYTQGLIRSIPRLDLAADAQGAAGGHSRHRAQADRAGRGLPLRRALQVRPARLPADDAAVARGGTGPRWPASWTWPDEPSPGCPKRARAPSCKAGPHGRGGRMSTAPLLQVKNLNKHFPIRGGLLQRVVDQVHAVDGVSFELAAGETLGAGRRIGLRQEHHRALHPAPDRAQRRRGAGSRAATSPRWPARSCARWRATCRSSSRTPSPA